MSDIMRVKTFICDLSAPLVVNHIGGIMMEGDALANALRIEVIDKTEEVDVSGWGVSGYLMRADGYRVPLSGTVEGNIVTVPLDEHCYGAQGAVAAFVRLTLGETRTTILKAVGYVDSDGDGPVIDPNDVIPSLDELLAMLSTLEAATQDANEAAQAAKAETAAVTAARQEAQDAVADAQEAVETAQGWAKAQMDVEMLSADSEPQASLETLEDGSKIILLQIPRGQTGATPVITIEVATGAPGTQATISRGGTAENPTFLLTIPRGDTGAIEGLDYYESEPMPLGMAAAGTSESVSRGDHAHPMPTAAEVGARASDWTPTAAEVGALAVGATATDSQRLGGVDAAEYAKTAQIPEFRLDGTTLYITTT